MTDTRTETTGTAPAGTRPRSRAGEAYDTTRAKTNAAYAGVHERASRAGQWTGREIESNPMAAIAGGFAIGAVIAALLPRTEREAELLGGVGHRINDAARDVARTAADAGRQQVEEITESAATKVGEAVIGAVAATTGAKADADAKA